MAAVSPPTAPALTGIARPPILFGLIAAVAVALVATAASRLVPLVGAPIFAILIAAAVQQVWPLGAAFRPGIVFAGRKVLQAAIIISGFSLSFTTVVQTGLATLPVTLATIAVALVLASIAGRLLGIDRARSQLIGVGTAICGASAIAAVATVTEPAEEDVALSIATIFLYNIAAVVIFPPLGHLMNLSQDAFGTWAGTAINDTSSVVAAGYAYGAGAGAHATIVKLARASMILPIVGAFALARARRLRASGSTIPWATIAPWFILWFVIAALVNTFAGMPVALHDPIVQTSAFLIAVALAGIGFQTNIPALIKAGSRPLALGLILWAAVALTSLIVQHLTGV